MYKVGDSVHLSKLRKNGVVVEIVSSSVCKVAIGSLIVQAKVAELESPKPERSVPSPHAQTSTKSRIRKREVDLHGQSVHDALQSVASAVNRAVMDHVEELRLLHGKGTGKLLLAIHEYLGTLAVVRSYSLDPKNPGVTRVFTA